MQKNFLFPQNSQKFRSIFHDFLCHYLACLYLFECIFHDDLINIKMINFNNFYYFILWTNMSAAWLVLKTPYMLTAGISMTNANTNRLNFTLQMSMDQKRSFWYIPQLLCQDEIRHDSCIKLRSKIFIYCHLILGYYTFFVCLFHFLSFWYLRFSTSEWSAWMVASLEIWLQIQPVLMVIRSKRIMDFVSF